MIYRFNTILVKILGDIFAEINKLILKLMWKSNQARIDKTIVEKIKIGGCILISRQCDIGTEIDRKAMEQNRVLK